MNDLIQERFIPLKEAADKIGQYLFGDEWQENALSSQPKESDEEGNNRLSEVQRTLVHLIREAKIEVRVDRYDGGRARLSEKHILGDGFTVDPVRGTVGSLFYPDDNADAYINVEEFDAQLFGRKRRLGIDRRSPKKSEGAVPGTTEKGPKATTIAKWKFDYDEVERVRGQLNSNLSRAGRLVAEGTSRTSDAVLKNHRRYRAYTKRQNGEK